MPALLKNEASKYSLLASSTIRRPQFAHTFASMSAGSSQRSPQKIQGRSDESEDRSVFRIRSSLVRGIYCANRRSRKQQRPVAGAFRPGWPARRKSGYKSYGFAFLTAALDDERFHSDVVRTGVLQGHFISRSPVRESIHQLGECYGGSRAKAVTCVIHRRDR
jgi:hypothetical protein